MPNRPITTNVHSDPCHICETTGRVSEPAKTILIDKMKALGIPPLYTIELWCVNCGGSGEILTEQVESFSDGEWLSNLEERVKELECK